MLGAAPRRPSFRRRVLSLVLVVALVGGAGTGADAHPSRADTVRADTLTRFQAAPLTVTVLRTTLERSLVPAAVTLTDATESARRGPGLGLDDALRAIPGLQIENRYNYSLGERVSIRGFGARAQFGVRGIRALVDGIPATLADGQTALDQIDLAGLGRAEVLRGAASSLYGNAAGGVILLESAPPPAAPLRQEVRVAGGSAGLLRLESRTGGTVGRGVVRGRPDAAPLRRVPGAQPRIEPLCDGARGVPWRAGRPSSRTPLRRSRRPEPRRPLRFPPRRRPVDGLPQQHCAAGREGE